MNLLYEDSYATWPTDPDGGVGNPYAAHYSRKRLTLRVGVPVDTYWSDLSHRFVSLKITAKCTLRITEPWLRESNRHICFRVVFTISILENVAVDPALLRKC